MIVATAGRNATAMIHELQNGCDVLRNWVTFTKKRTTPNNLSIRVSDVQTKPYRTIKYLGVTLDTQLEWRQHLGRTCLIAKKTSMEMRRFPRLTSIIKNPAQYYIPNVSLCRPSMDRRYHVPMVYQQTKINSKASAHDGNTQLPNNINTMIYLLMALGQMKVQVTQPSSHAAEQLWNNQEDVSQPPTGSLKQKVQTFQSFLAADPFSSPDAIPFIAKPQKN